MLNTMCPARKIFLDSEEVNKTLKNTKLIVVQTLCVVQVFASPQIIARQAFLSSTISQSLLKFMSIELVMLCNHRILCHPQIH